MRVIVIVAAWLLLATLLGLAFAAGAGIGFRRGWEERDAVEREHGASVHPTHPHWRHRRGGPPGPRSKAS